MVAVNSPSWSFYERHFSVERLEPYLFESGGDEVAAMRLYDWNAEISAAFWESLGFFEVALRNTIDKQMAVIHAKESRSRTWIFDDASVLGRDLSENKRHGYPYVDIDKAIRRIKANRKPISSGQIISELTFGFWHQMVSKKQNRFWPELRAAFPNAPDRNQATIQIPVSRLRDFRNRIGHHHRVPSFDVAARYKDVLTVTQYIDLELATWIDTKSRVKSLLASKPQPLSGNRVG